ncbi:MAG: AzlC family ABC transporter permease [Clostridiales bacterium]|nr:AzlC family ABC transporter permease [Clostridiales bacterium]
MARQTDSRSSDFKAGLMHGLPIGMGYLSVSFSFGVLAISMGLSWWQAILISLTNVTSAGQVAGIGIMSASGGLIEMAVSQLVINVRYSLMSISLSQKADSSFNWLSRIFLSFGITDEIFGVAMGHGDSFSRKYFAGLMVLPLFGWTLGTALGALIGSVLPAFLIDSLSIGIYGMFIAIVLPVARKKYQVAIVSAISVAISVLLYYVDFFSFLSSGFMYIISAVVAALIGALFLPLSKTEVNADA